MAIVTDSSLTSDELMHLAIEASNRARYDLSITYLKEAYTKSEHPAAEIPFLLGAQYAQINMAEDAKKWMSEAVRLRPDFEIAHFQLGLLHLLGGQMDVAEATWANLGFLPAGHPLLLFRDGLLALARNQVILAMDCLKAGIAEDYPNQPLQAEMRRILANIEAAQTEAQALPSTSDSNSSQSNTEEHILLSGYKG